MSKPNIKLFIFSLVLIIALVAVYSNHFNNEFHFDDSHTVVENTHIRNIANIPSFFSDPRTFSADPDHWGMRPLVTTTLAIDYWLGGSLKPFFFHLDTFIWFIGLLVMIFFMFRYLLQFTLPYRTCNYVAFFSTALYGFHKTNAETINYVISRSDVLSTFFIVGSFLIYVVVPSSRKFYLYIIPAIIGVFAKETVLVLVIIVFFYILLFEKELSLSQALKLKNFQLLAKTFIAVLPLLIAVAIVQYYTLSKVKVESGMTNPFLPYVLTQSYVWVRYFLAFFVPMNLSADTDWTVIQNLYDERIIIGLVFVGLLIYAIFKTSEKKEMRVISFGLVWFAAALLPTSLAPFSEVTNDHRMFFPFIGLSLAMVYAITLWLNKYQTLKAKRSYRTLIATAFLLVLSLHSYGVYQRNKVWKTEESLWRDVTIKSPGNGRGMMNYGLVLMGKGNYTEAELYFKKALLTLPYYSTLHINLAILNGAMGKPADAEQYFRKAIELNPKGWDAYAFFARFLKQNNRNAEAEEMAQKSIERNPYSVMGFDILLAVYNDRHEWEKLAATAKSKLAFLPDDPIAKTYLEASSKQTQVISAGSPPTQAKPATEADYLNLSLQYYNQQAYEKCIEACIEALKIKPDYADAYSNIGAAYNQLRQWKRGIEACKKALKIDPNHKLAAGNLSWAESELNKQSH